MSAAQSLIINHYSVSSFDSIPEAYKSAAVNTRMLFMDRSVGYNISTYLDCLSQPWSTAPSYCKRFQHMDSIYDVDPSEVHWSGTWDRSNWRYAFWPDNCSEDVTCFVDYMEDRLDSFDVMGCAFSYLAMLPGSKIADTITGFFGDSGSDNKASTYMSFATDHPDKKVIWWTSSLARGVGSPESESFNAQMRQYAATHDIILFDVADILSYDPSGLPCYDNRDGVTYKDENYPDDSLAIPAICPQYTTETEGGHLGAISAGGIRVVKALWVLMAKLSGWQEATTSVYSHASGPLRIWPNPAAHEVNVSVDRSEVSGECEMRVYDIQGRVLLKAEIHNSSEGVTRTIPLKNFSPGLYFIHVSLGKEWYVSKLLVKG